VEATAEKHKAFAQQIEERDSEIFITIPCLRILRSLEDDDKNICKSFYPDMFDDGKLQGIIYTELKKDFVERRTSFADEYEIYNLLERELLEVNSPGSSIVMEWLPGLAHRIKQLAMELSRNKPTDWNEFMDVIVF
jgi:hypothetical protein